MIILILMVIAIIISIAIAIDESDGFLAFYGIVIIGLVGAAVLLFSSVLYTPDETTTEHRLQKITENEVIQSVGDQYVFQINGDVIKENKDDVTIVLVEPDQKAYAEVEANKGGVNVVGVTDTYAWYTLYVPTDAVDVIG